MDKLTSAQKAVQAVRDDNVSKVATIEIKDVKYDVVYKNDKGEFCDLTGLDEEVKALASAVLSAHETKNPKLLGSRDISHIDSTGVHYTDKTDETHESVKLDTEGFKTLDKHLGITSTINGISTVYKGVEALAAEDEINYEAVLGALDSDLSDMVLKEITPHSGDLTREGFLRILDKCANEYLSEKLDISSGVAAAKEAIFHKGEGKNQINRAASLQAFKDAATARDAWDAMNAAIAKTHLAAAKAPIPSSSSLLPGLTLAPRLNSTKHEERAKGSGKNPTSRRKRKQTKKSSGNLSSPQPTPTSTSLGSRSTQYKAPPSVKSSKSHFFEDDSSDDGVTVSYFDPQFTQLNYPTHSKGRGMPVYSSAPTNSSFLTSSEEEQEIEEFYTPPTSPVYEKRNSFFRASDDDDSSNDYESVIYSETELGDKNATSTTPSSTHASSTGSTHEVSKKKGDSKPGAGVNVVRRKLDRPATSHSSVDWKSSLSPSTSASSSVRKEKESTQARTQFAVLAQQKKQVSQQTWYQSDFVPKDTQAASQKILDYLEGKAYLDTEALWYLFNLVGQVEAKKLKPENEMEELKLQLELKACPQ